MTVTNRTTAMTRSRPVSFSGTTPEFPIVTFDEPTGPTSLGTANQEQMERSTMWKWALRSQL